MTVLRRGLFLGVAFGLAAGAVTVWLGMFVVVQRRMGGGPFALLETLALDVALGAVLGLLAAPLLRTPAGRWGHLAALALGWAALVKWVELDSPMFTSTQYAPPALGALLAAAGMALARRRAWLAWACGLALAAVGLVAPSLYLAATTPSFGPRADRPAAASGAPDVVLVVLDTIRAESLSAYGYERPTSPVLDALAREGALFLDATSPSTWSLPSHASLFTGRYPSGHGAHMEHRFLGGTFPTLAEALSLAGYETFCFTANPWISDGLGLTRGFSAQFGTGGGGDMFDFAHRVLAKLGVEAEDKGGAAVAEAFESWAAARPADAPPAFVFLNFLEAHFPYHQLPDEYLHRFTDRPRSELREVSLETMAAQFGGTVSDHETARRDARDMYDGGVLYSDYLFGRVVEALRARGTLDDTVLVMLGDHGELLGEKAEHYGHGPTLYQPMIHVPLYLRHPPAVPGGARVARPVSTVGVYATILDLVGVEPPPTLQVGSLLPALRGEAPRGPVLAERFKASSMGVGFGNRGDPQMRADVRFRAYRDGPWKLVDTSEGRAFLYDVRADPREERDLSDARPEQVARLRARLDTVLAELGLPRLDAELGDLESPELDAATRERLKALGYLE